MKLTLTFTLDNTVDTAKSTAFELPEWAKKCTIQIPTIVSGTVSLEFMKIADVTAAKLAASSDTSWVGVERAVDSVGNLVNLHNGTGGKVIDCTKLIEGLGEGYLRVTCGGVQNAVTTWYVHFVS